MADNALFIDTWGWITIANKEEPRHHEILQFYQEARRRKNRIFTSDHVLGETITLLFGRVPYNAAVPFIEGLLATAANGLPQVERIGADRFSTTWELRKRYHDKPRISFTDLTSMVIMSELGIQKVLTEDEHFMHVGMGFVRVP